MQLIPHEGVDPISLRKAFGDVVLMLPYAFNEI